MKKISVILVLAISSHIMICKAQAPSWNINPLQYSYSLSYTGTALIDGLAAGDSSDMVAAFINNECRGVSSPVYIESIKKWVFFLTIYSNFSNDTIRFKYYQEENDSIYNMQTEVVFVANYLYGSALEPYVTANTEVDEALLLSYHIPGQIRSKIANDTVYITYPPDLGHDNIIATFDLSPGATARIGETVQFSGESKNNYSGLLEYTIVSGDKGVENTYYVIADYYQMDITASALIDGGHLNTQNDTVFAYLENVMVARSNAVFVPEIGKYRYLLHIENYTNAGEISFKAFVNELNATINLRDIIDFNEEDNKGTLFNPVQFSNTLLEGNSMLSYSLPGQMKEARFDGDTITILMPPGADLTDLAPQFALSDGAIAETGDSVQYGEYTRIDFSSPVTYNVYNYDRTIMQTYTVEVVYHEMNVIASVWLNKFENRVTNDTLMAYIDGALVAYALPVTVSEINKQRYNLRIVHYDPEAEIHFKLADNSDSLITLYNNLDFVNATSKGTYFKPIVLSDIPLTAKAIESFSINGQLGSTRIHTNEIVVKMPPEIALDALTPMFETGPGAQVIVSDSIQYPGYTQNDFSFPLQYTVYNFDHTDSVSYTVKVVYYYMDLVATVFTDNAENIQIGDSLYAFINDNLSGRAAALLETSINKLRFPITVVHYDPQATISFKYKNSQGNFVALVNTIEFDDETSVGTMFNPVVLSDQVLQGTEIEDFTIGNQIGSTRIIDSMITVKMPKEAGLNNLLANFKLSPGASLFIDDSIYYPDYTEINFTAPVEAKVYNADRTLVKSYRIELVKNFMKVTASVFIDNTEITDVQYPLYALVGTEVTQPISMEVDGIYKTRFEFDIAHYDSLGKVQFGYGNPDQGDLFQRSVNYVNGRTEGTLFEPFVLSDPVLNEARILSFALPGQRGATVYEDTLIKVVMDDNVDLTNVAPEFSISEGAQLYIHDSVFYSAYTTTDFTSPFIIKVLSADGKTQRQYLFSILKADFTDFVTSTIVSPNGDGANDTWKIKDAAKYFESRIIIFDQQGRVVYESIGYDNTWEGRYEGDLLPRGTYMYIVKSQDGTVNKGTISLIY